jgi:hypothetical protein
MQQSPWFYKNWVVFLKCVTRTVEFLEQERVFDYARLPTDVVIPVLVALWGVALWARGARRAHPTINQMNRLQC